tara:strand:+ start:1512 stop:2399 length:888 start_codon:yes stop_codon:yes gene_type:complete
MSRLVNNNFNRDTKLDPSNLNSKFQDVSTAVNNQVDQNNIRDSAIDVPQFNTNTSNGKSGIQLVYIETNDLGTVGGTAVNRVSVATPVAMPTTWNLNSGTAITLTQDDIIRVYWHTEISTNWSAENAVMFNHFMAQYLEWNFHSAGFTPVPGQTNFNNTTPSGLRNGAEVANTKATTLIPYFRIIDDGSTAANTAPTDPSPGGYAFITGDATSSVATGRKMASGSWIHKVTAGEAGAKTISLKLVMQGPIMPWYDVSGGTAGNWLVDYSSASMPAIDPIMTFYNTNIVFMIMRSK